MVGWGAMTLEEAKAIFAALEHEKVDFVVALIMGWTEGANKWESTENAGFSHVINKKLEFTFVARDEI